MCVLWRRSRAPPCATCKPHRVLLVSRSVASLGSLLRLDSSSDYSEENTCISVKIQFLAIEIARNKGGFNDDLRKNFKPTPRKSKQQQSAEDASTAEVEAELKQVLSGQHPLLS